MSTLTKLTLVGVLVSLAAVAALPPADAAAVSFKVTGTKALKFTFEGVAGDNPTVNVNAGDSVTITASSEDTTPHNFQVGTTTKIAGPTTPFSGNKTETLTWTVPSDASDITYICTIHGTGMSGKFHVQGAAAPAKTPGFGFAVGALALAGAALVVSRKSR